MKSIDTKDLEQLNDEQQKEKKLSAKEIQMVDFAKDIITHLCNIQENNNHLQRLSQEQFCRMDTDGSGSIHSKDLVHIFGHNDHRVDNQYSQALFQGGDQPQSIDKYEFYKYVKIAIEILKVELHNKINNICENSLYSLRSKGLDINEDEYILRTMTSIQDSVEMLKEFNQADSEFLLENDK